MQGDRDPRRVRSMFDGIAPRYDLLNHLLSASLDRGWRRAAAAELPHGDRALVLDLCGGTGDLSLAASAARPRATVVCCDFSHPMLLGARRKFARRRAAGRCLPLGGDALRLPFAPGVFDAATVGFGVRNFADLDAGLRELYRVLAPGGRLVVLEFSSPDGPVVSRLYRVYRERLLPAIGDRVAGVRGPYGYLARTIGAFPEPALLAGRIREAGFAACGWQRKTGGIVAIHTAFKA